MTWLYVEYGGHVPLSWRCWEHVHTIHATNHVGHEKKSYGFLFLYMHVVVSIVMGL